MRKLKRLEPSKSEHLVKLWLILFPKMAVRQMETRPSILCVTQKRAFMPLHIVLGQQRVCMPVYIGKVEIWSGDTDA